MFNKRNQNLITLKSFYYFSIPDFPTNGAEKSIMPDYTVIENKLLQLLKLLNNIFTKSEANEVQGFIDAAEYGLALEAIVCIIEKESKVVSQEVVDLAKEAAVTMGLDENIVEVNLTRKGDLRLLKQPLI